MAFSGRSGLPLVAVVGRPNVGKSSLVNRVLGRREAIVEEMPGVTRDRTGFVAAWNARDFEIMDTGGLEPGAEGLEAHVRDQARVAIEIADVIVLVVDAAAGPIEDDLAVADVLRRSGKPVVVAANKVDDPADEADAARFYGLGLGEPHPLSALHGRGSGDFLDAVVRVLPAAPGETQQAWASLAIVGRPNVGKSSMLNSLLGEQRAIVDAAPGTTRDPVDSYLPLAGDRTLRIIDTAGMRRQAHITDPVEYFGFLRSRRTIPRADAVLLVVDVAEGVAGLDQRIAQEVVDEGRACVVALNKWDLVTSEETDRARLERDVKKKLRFLDWATVVRTSARTGRGVDRLLPAVESAIETHRRRLPTALVNRLVTDAQQRAPHPRARARTPRVLYAVQADVAPPTFVLFASARLETNYVRYIENAIRAVHPFAGTPIQIRVRLKTAREREDDV
ncbi:MAG: ribosome biogenesis GTPase Der [Actinomycetota bacterium]